jgi:hypothetical protein
LCLAFRSITFNLKDEEIAVNAADCTKTPKGKLLPRPRTDRYWLEKIASYAINDERLGPARVERLLQGDGARDGRRDRVPSRTSIAREMPKARSLTGQVRDAYLFAHWPEICDSDVLPWEASNAVLELIGYLGSNGPPTIDVARCYWRVTLARPDLPVAERLKAARALAAWKLVPHPQNARPLEQFLAGQVPELTGVTFMGPAEAPTPVVLIGQHFPTATGERRDRQMPKSNKEEED